MASPPVSDTGSTEKVAQQSGIDPATGKKEWKTAPFFVKPGPRFGHRYAQRTKRWWPLDFFIFAAVTLIITLPIIYVGYPNIAQSDIKSTSVTVDGISLTDPTVNSFVFGLNSTLRPTTNYRPDLYSFNMTLALAGAASPFITVEVPQLHITKPTSLNISNQRVTIESQSAWQDFLVAAFANETYGIHSQGKPNLKLGALPTDSVTFDKTIYVPGLNGLRNITTTNIKINTTSTTNNFNANVTIINPSNSDFTIGDVTYKNYIMPNMTYIGDSFIPNLVLRPGNNTVPTNASVQNGPVIDALGERPACATGMVETILVPSNVTYNGVELPYYLKSLANVTQLLPLGQAIESATMGLAKYYCK